MNILDIREFNGVFQKDVEKKLIEQYGENKWRDIKQALKIPPQYTSLRINSQRISRIDAIKALSIELEAFNNKLKDIGRLPVEVLPHSLIPDAIIIPLAPAPVNLKGFDVNQKKHVLIDRVCAEAVLRGSDIYAPGILAASNSIHYGDIVNILVDIDGKTTRGTTLHSLSFTSIYIGRGETHMSRSDYFKSSKGLAIKVTERLLGDAPPLNGVLRGLVYMQNLPSILVSHILAPKPGDVIIDLCAGPGGKTSHIATLMQNKGLLIACDRSKRKAEDIKNLCDEIGHSCVVALKMNSIKIVLPQNEGFQEPQGIIQEATQRHNSQDGLLKIRGFSAETFDKVLLDPPCSALGLRPRLAHTETLKELETYCCMQRNLLWSAVYLLKPGGTLVYSTCTLNPEENECMIRHALDKYPLKLQQQELRLGKAGLPNQGLNPDECSYVQRFDPAETDLPGFFCAKFTKIKSIRDIESNTFET